MIDWYKKAVFENYANFSGRARRSEYWYFVLGNFIIEIILYTLFISLVGISSAADMNSEAIGGFGIALIGIIALYSIAILIPSISVCVRRLHDIGKSGWFYFIGFIPLVGPILLLVWFLTEGERGHNNWGEDPKAINSTIDELGIKNN